MRHFQTPAPRPGVHLHLIPWPAVRTAVLRAWQAASSHYFLTGTSWQVLELITRLQWVFAVKSPSHAAYCVPSEKWLAFELNICRETVSDSVRVLEAHGLLSITRRRPVRHEFQTNLYRMAGRSAAYLVSALRRGRFARAVVSHNPPQGALRVTPSSHVESPTGFDTLIRTWLKRGEAPTTPSNG
jgi:hypothetical protein